MALVFPQSVRPHGPVADRYTVYIDSWDVPGMGYIKKGAMRTQIREILVRDLNSRASNGFDVIGRFRFEAAYYDNFICYVHVDSVQFDSIPSKRCKARFGWIDKQTRFGPERKADLEALFRDGYEFRGPTKYKNMWVR